MALKGLVLSAYIVMIIVVGIIGLRKTTNFKDFLLGGGNIGPIMTAFTYGTAYFSAVLFIGFAGKIGWAFGFSSLWISLGNSIIGVFAVWWLIGYKIKKMSVDLGVSTLAEYFEKRYNSKFMKLLCSISIFVFLIPYSAAVFMGLSYLFKSNFNLEYWHSLVFMGFFTALYMSLGGYKSMTIIDVIFGIIMIVGVAILLVFTLHNGGGLTSITDKLSSFNSNLTKPVGPPGIRPLFYLIFLTSIAPFAMPQLIQKFYAIRDKKAIKTGMIVSSIFALFITGIAYFVGSTTRIFLNPENAPQAFKNGSPVFDALMPELLVRIIPESLSIIMLVLILSASMSTLAALILISSSSLTKDFYAGFFNKKASDKFLTFLMRCSSVFFVILSVVLAFFKPTTIVSILAISWGAIGSVFLGPFVWGLFSKKVNKFGAIASSLLGLSTCLLLYYRGSPSPEAGTIGMIISFTTTPVLSFCPVLIQNFVLIKNIKRNIFPKTKRLRNKEKQSQTPIVNSIITD